MALSTFGLRRVLRGSSATLPQWKWSFSPVRQSSSFPPDDGAGGGGNLPPLVTPKLFVSGDDNKLDLVPLIGQQHQLYGKCALICSLLPLGAGLSRLTTDEKLREAFSPYGQLLEAKVITDRVSGRSKGFGFVRYATIEEAGKARHGMNAKFLDGWVIFVDPAKPREPKPQPPEPEPSVAGIRTNKTIGWCG